MVNKKILLTIVLAIFIVILGLFIYSRLSKITNHVLSQKADTSNNLQSYLGTAFEFSYPKIFSLIEQENTVTLRHTVSYTHPNPCDFKGDAPPLKEITDFNVSFKVFNKNLTDTIFKNETSYLIKDAFKNVPVSTSSGFIDAYHSGMLSGYKITTGLEGCGLYTYYFPLSTNQTLRITRSFITELEPVIADYQKYLSLPWIIIPTKEEKFFNQILTSFKKK